MTTTAPAWATKQKAERVELKAARLAALYQMRDQLHGTPKTHLAEALGISRWTYDRLLASLPEVNENIRLIKIAIEQEIQPMTTQLYNAEKPIHPKPDYFSDPTTRLAYDVYQLVYQPYGEADPDAVNAIEEWIRAGDPDGATAEELAAEFTDTMA